METVLVRRPRKNIQLHGLRNEAGHLLSKRRLATQVWRRGFEDADIRFGSECPGSHSFQIRRRNTRLLKLFGPGRDT
jgi:hypothetical protein